MQSLTDINIQENVKKQGKQPFTIEVHRRSDDKKCMTFIADTVKCNGKLISFFLGDGNEVACYSLKQYYHLATPTESKRISIDSLAKRFSTMLLNERSASLRISENAILYGELYQRAENRTGVSFSAADMENHEAVKNMTCDFSDLDEIASSLSWICSKLNIPYIA